MTIKDPLDMYLLNGVISGGGKKEFLNADVLANAKVNMDCLSESANDTINPSDTMRQLVEQEVKCGSIKGDDETVLYKVPESPMKKSNRASSKGSRNTRYSRSK
jgi:hypothetical protein